MKYWNFGVFIDPGHTALCYAASVLADNEKVARYAHREELKLIPIHLFIGTLQVQLSSAPNTLQSTFDHNVI
jgi:hypothetical protein